MDDPVKIFRGRGQGWGCMGVNTATVALGECLQPGTMVVGTPMAHLVPKVDQSTPQFAPALVAAAVSVCPMGVPVPPV